MAEADHGLLAKVLDQAKSEIGQFEKLRDSVGTTFAVLIVLVLAIIFIWWKWDELSKKPAVAKLLALLRRRRIVAARPGRLTVAIAHLEGDQNREYENLLRDALDNDFEGAESRPVDRTVILAQDAATGQEAVGNATEQARQLLQRSRADVMIWGKVVRLGSKSAMRLYWTTAHQHTDVKRTESYTTDTLALPPLFWDDLKQVLGMLAQSRLAAISQVFTGHYRADKLEPLIGQVRRLLQARQGTWTAEVETSVRFALADALQDLRDAGGQQQCVG